MGIVGYSHGKNADVDFRNLCKCIQCKKLIYTVIILKFLNFSRMTSPIIKLALSNVLPNVCTKTNEDMADVALICGAQPAKTWGERWCGKKKSYCIRE